MTLREDDLAQFFRVPVYIPVDYDGREMLLPCRLTNISINGAFIANKPLLPLGSKIDLRFQLPGERALLSIPSTVRWSRGSPQKDRPVAGVTVYSAWD